MKEYKQHLVDSALNLTRLMFELDANIAHLLVDIGIEAEDTFFENGEVTLFDVKDFAAGNDKNIQELIKLHGLVNETYELFTDVNDISALDSMELFDEGVFNERLGVVGRWNVTGEKMFAMETVVPRGYPCPGFDKETFASAYRQHLVKTVVTLGWYGQEVYSNILNLVMNGAFAEANERLRGNGDLRHNMADFEGVDDRNVQELIKIYDTVIAYHGSLCEINNIQEEEVLFFVHDPEDDE